MDGVHLGLTPVPQPTDVLGLVRRKRGGEGGREGRGGEGEGEGEEGGGGGGGKGGGGGEGRGGEGRKGEGRGGEGRRGDGGEGGGEERRGRRGGEERGGEGERRGRRTEGGAWIIELRGVCAARHPPPPHFHLFPHVFVIILKRCKFHGLKNTLNLHPASGMQPWEEKYSEMAEAMGIDPTVSVSCMSWSHDMSHVGHMTCHTLVT